eukprot:COSAG01_NODE_13573_length_1566_cov_1.184731_2_plen_64_part_00
MRCANLPVPALRVRVRACVCVCVRVRVRACVRAWCPQDAGGRPSAAEARRILGRTLPLPPGLR